MKLKYKEVSHNLSNFKNLVLKIKYNKNKKERYNIFSLLRYLFNIKNNE
jgi:hypothetical protein